jgi:hypothetical protein
MTREKDSGALQTMRAALTGKLASNAFRELDPAEQR